MAQDSTGLSATYTPVPNDDHVATGILSSIVDHEFIAFENYHEAVSDLAHTLRYHDQSHETLLSGPASLLAQGPEEVKDDSLQEEQTNEA